MHMPQAPPPPPAHPLPDQHLPAHFGNMSLHTEIPHFNPNPSSQSPIFDGHHNARPQTINVGLSHKVNPKDAVSYEGYVFTKLMPNPGQAETWARVQKKPMKMSQKELYAEAKKQKNRGPSAQQMLGYKRQQIDHLIEERTRTDDDPGFQYTQASLKLNKNINGKGQPETKSMEVILKRSLRPDVIHAASMRGRAEGGVEVVDLTRSPFDDGSSQDSYPMSGHSFTGFQEPPMMHHQEHFAPTMHGGPGAHLPVHPGPHMDPMPQHGVPHHGHQPPVMHDHDQFMDHHGHQYGFPPEHQHPGHGADHPSFPEHQFDLKAGKKDKKDKKKDKKEHKGQDKHYEEFSDRIYEKINRKDKKTSKKGHKKHDKHYDDFSDRSSDSSDVDSDTSYRTPATTISTDSGRDYPKEKKYHSDRKEKAHKSRDHERDRSPRRQIYRQHRRKSPARLSPVRSYRIDRRHYDDEEYEIIPGGLRDRPHPVRRATDYPQHRPSLDHHRGLSYDDDIYGDTRRSPPIGRRPTSIYTQRRLNPAPPMDLYHEERERDDVVERELRREAAQRERLREVESREFEELRREKARRDDELFRRDRMVKDRMERPIRGERLPRFSREHDYY